MKFWKYYCPKFLDYFLEEYFLYIFDNYLLNNFNRYDDPDKLDGWQSFLKYRLPSTNNALESANYLIKQ